MVPVRASKTLGATANETVPGPAPLADDVRLSQFTALAAVHGQPAAVDTVVEPPLPAAGKDADVGEML